MRSVSWKLFGQVECRSVSQRRHFHDYFVTHLPSSSLHPDARSSAGPSQHKLPRDQSTPHENASEARPPTSIPPTHGQSVGISRNTTVVRIPLKSAKHHYGAQTSRGSRSYNEDKYQAGTIDLPAFAQRQPLSLSRRKPGQEQKTVSQGAQNASGDPQVFYFGVFDGHGGEECSNFLKDRLHGYIEDAAQKFGIQSSLTKPDNETEQNEASTTERQTQGLELQRTLVDGWKATVGGYFKRFRPEYFTALHHTATSERSTSSPAIGTPSDSASLEAVLTYAFLSADLDFTKAQAKKHSNSPTSDDPVLDDRPLNDGDVLYQPSRPASQNLTSLLTAPIGGNFRFKGGSTGSIALLSTPSPTPFWHPISPATIVVAHVGDTRILLCRVSDGQSVPMTSDHHPSAPMEATRLRRYAAAFVTDSFGEERVAGLANTRAFGDIASKRIGVSAEPEILTMQLAPSDYSFMVLMSDGISGTLSDQEVVDIVKEARTPDQASKDVVNFATEVSAEDADNATCLVVRLGGWERRGEGGMGSMGTKEMRDFKKRDAEDPRSRRT